MFTHYTFTFSFYTFLHITHLLAMFIFLGVIFDDDSIHREGLSHVVKQTSTTTTTCKTNNMTKQQQLTFSMDVGVFHIKLKGPFSNTIWGKMRRGGRGSNLLLTPPCLFNKGRKQLLRCMLSNSQTRPFELWVDKLKWGEWLLTHQGSITNLTHW